MAEIKNTTAEQAIANARAKLDEDYQLAKHQLDRAAEAVLVDLATRAAALADVSQLLERAKHIWVKDHTPNPHSSPVPLDYLRLQTGGPDIRIVDSSSSAEVASYLEPGKRYRFWLLLEELKP
jgi:hypothetical protein